MARRDVRICEVGPRDGLQLVRRVMATPDKLRWLAALADCGLPELDAASFVPPQAFPQFADAAEVLAAARASHAGWRVGALVPNRRGAERAIAAGSQMLFCIVSASESHSMANTRRTREQQADIVGEVVELARAGGDSRPLVSGGIPTAFGCSIEGRVAEAEVCRVAVMLAKRGLEEIGLADTVGYADPALVKRLVRAVRDAVGPEMPLRLHFHDTMGLGLANVLAGLDAGVTVFDAASGGLGGCPFAPGASGNIATEDLVFMLEQMGLRTGVDLGKLIAATDVLAAALPDETIRSHVGQAGVPKVYGAAA
jgi:hydroxymethylglutaryl-CoA lyase